MEEPDFDRIAFECRGMLAPSIYKRMYWAARDRPAGDIVEVGTSRGAATISLALGLQHSGKPGLVYSFGRPQRPVEGVCPVRANFARFGVDHVISYSPGEVDELSAAVPSDSEIGLLLMDADGSIDRDLGLFYERLASGAPIIIDDCQDLVRVSISRSGRFNIDAKMRLATKLLEHFVSRDVIAPGDQMKDTYFGTKGNAARSAIDSAEIVRVYRSLVFTRAEQTLRQNAKRAVISYLDTLAPRLTHRIRTRVRNERAGAATTHSHH